MVSVHSVSLFSTYGYRGEGGRTAGTGSARGRRSGYCRTRLQQSMEEER